MSLKKLEDKKANIESAVNTLVLKSIAIAKGKNVRTNIQTTDSRVFVEFEPTITLTANNFLKELNKRTFKGPNSDAADFTFPLNEENSFDVISNFIEILKDVEYNFNKEDKE